MICSMGGATRTIDDFSSYYDPYQFSVVWYIGLLLWFKREYYFYDKVIEKENFSITNVTVKKYLFGKEYVVDKYGTTTISFPPIRIEP